MATVMQCVATPLLLGECVPAAVLPARLNVNTNSRLLNQIADLLVILQALEIQDISVSTET